MFKGISEGLKGEGFSPEIHDLSYFQDDYGLTPINGEDDDNDDDDEDNEDDDEGEDDGDDAKEDSDELNGSEGYEIVEGNDDEIDDE